MLPDPSIGGCWLQNSKGRQILNFNLRHGDKCPEDSYDKTEERAYLVFDANSRSIRPPFTPVRLETGPEMLPGPTISSWWLSLAQWNQWPGPDNALRPPPFSLNIAVINGKEFLVGIVRQLDRFGKIHETEFASMPFERKRYQINADFLCSNGTEGGYCSVTVDGRTLDRYVGPTGYAGRNIYAAVGIYRATPLNPLDKQTVMYGSFREGLAL